MTVWQPKIFRITLIFFIILIASCHNSRLDVASEINALEDALGITGQPTRHCGIAANVSQEKRSAFQAKKRSFLTDEKGQETDRYISVPSGDRSLKEFTAEVLVSVPPSILVQIFNNELQGQIVISNDAVEEHCRPVGNISNFGCVLKKPNEPLRLYMIERKSVIGVKLLQLFANTMSHTINQTHSAMNNFSLTSSTDAITQQFMQEINTFVTMRRELLQAFDADTAAIQTESMAKFRAMPPQEKLDYVFSHTIDSVYCSAESMENFNRMSKSGQLTKTYNAFFGIQNTSSRNLYAIIGLPWYTEEGK